MGDDTYRMYLKESNELDYSLYRSFDRHISTKMTDREGRPLIIVKMENWDIKYLALNDNHYQSLFQYLINKLDKLVDKEYSIIYIDHDDSLPIPEIKHIYKMFPRKYHKNLHKLYLVLPHTVKVKCTASLIQPLFSKKIKVIDDVYDFYEEIPAGCIQLPEWVLDEYAQTPHAIFGGSLISAVTTNYRGVSGLPFIVDCAVQYFSANAEALYTKGVFRESGTKSVVDSYINAFNYCKVFQFPVNENPHVVCSVLKAYLKSLPEPLLTPSTGEKIVEIFSLP